MQAEAGNGLSCRAHEWTFERNGTVMPHSVISYYAGATLAKADDVLSWHLMIQAMSQQDVANGKLPSRHQLMLQLCGDEHLPLIGKAQDTDSQR